MYAFVARQYRLPNNKNKWFGHKIIVCFVSFISYWRQCDKHRAHLVTVVCCMFTKWFRLLLFVLRNDLANQIVYLWMNVECVVQSGEFRSQRKPRESLKLKFWIIKCFGHVAVGSRYSQWDLSSERTYLIIIRIKINTLRFCKSPAPK